ncbi:GNAT family N-acetyltransferase [Bacillus sp. AK128]
MKIRKLNKEESPPMELLLLADPSREAIQGYLKSGDCYIAELKGEVVGVYITTPIKEDTIELMNVSVKETMQGKGVGKQLVTHAIKVAREKGYRKIEVGTGNSSINQLALYQKCGFRMERINQDYFIKNYQEEIFENGIQCIDMVRLSQKLVK